MIRLETTIPPSANNAYPTGAHGKRFPTAEVKSWKSALGWNFAASRMKPIRGPYAVTIEVDRKCRRDLDNLAKVTLDALVDAGATDDDKHLQEITIRRADVKGAVITVEAAS
jgi:Holliday junction resolvase RusA-like endonuclease